MGVDRSAARVNRRDETGTIFQLIPPSHTDDSLNSNAISPSIAVLNLRSNQPLMSIPKFPASVTPNLKAREWRPARMLRPQHQLDRVAGGPLTVPLSEDQTFFLIARHWMLLRFDRVDLECLRQQLHRLRFSLQPDANQKPRPESVHYRAQHPSCEFLINAHIARLTASIRVQVHVAEESIRVCAARRACRYNRTREPPYLAPVVFSILVVRVGVPDACGGQFKRLSGKVWNREIRRSARGRS